MHGGFIDDRSNQPYIVYAATKNNSSKNIWQEIYKKKMAKVQRLYWDKEHLLIQTEHRQTAKGPMEQSHY